MLLCHRFTLLPWPGQADRWKAAWSLVLLSAKYRCLNIPAKAVLFLLQQMGLLPEEMNAAAVAQFLRCCPGLNKQTTGELLGEYDDFFLEVLQEFTDTFDFTGTPLLVWLLLHGLPVSNKQPSSNRAFMVNTRQGKECTIAKNSIGRHAV